MKERAVKDKLKMSRNIYKKRYTVTKNDFFNYTHGVASDSLATAIYNIHYPTLTSPKTFSPSFLYHSVHFVQCI